MLTLRRQSLAASAVFLFTVLLATASSCSALVVQSAPSRPTIAVTSAAAERTLRLQWAALFENHRWTELDSLAERLRSQQLRFQGGGWQLHVLYCILSTGCLKTQSDVAWEKRIAELQDWSRYAPSSPTPRIALADAYQDFAWKARGNGYADSVTAEGGRLFNERVQKAREILEQSEEIGRGDPEWYNSMLDVAINQGWSAAQVQALADEALSKEPGYFYVVRRIAEYLQPKWYGAPGDSERFVEAAAERIGGDEGDATYFFYAEIQIVEEDLCVNCLPLGISWSHIRKGYAAIGRLYGINNYELNALADLSLRAGEFQTAQQVFKKIGDNWDPDVWPSKLYFDKVRNFAYTRPIPLAPSKPAGTAH